ncbi:hypothetical protein Taro_051251 [Colocasia esculenta]|uniref:Uncharacterized protein n=1 Tax=Colocasia esculenta TaxID=4460 RepID=A0A843XG76_COLES|nr:hypothetical protein [Colocasia esculenta]
MRFPLTSRRSIERHRLIAVHTSEVGIALNARKTFEQTSALDSSALVPGTEQPVRLLNKEQSPSAWFSLPNRLPARYPLPRSLQSSHSSPCDGYNGSIVRSPRSCGALTTGPLNGRLDLSSSATGDRLPSSQWRPVWCGGTKDRPFVPLKPPLLGFRGDVGGSEGEEFRDILLLLGRLMFEEKDNAEKSFALTSDFRAMLCMNELLLENMILFSYFWIGIISSVNMNYLLRIVVRTAALTDISNRMEASNPATEASPKPQTLYRCKRCRRIVAAQENVVLHNQGEGDQCFRKKKRGNQLAAERKPECSSIFVEPMKWMQTVQEGTVEHKLWCLGCKARLGSFNWAGAQCSCGAWVNPAFQLHKSRIDECTT